jgi:hypothetical protein
MIEFLKGKKTYIVVGLMLALALLTKDERLLLEALAIAGLRNAL